jgi:hypothetical protein
MFVGQPCCDQLLNNIWYDKMQPFHSNLSGRIRLLLSICTFGLLAPALVPFRNPQLAFEYSLNERKQNNDLMINQKEEEENILLKPPKTNRYRF